eukprot:Gb_03305 [translate_table: standard]
MRSRAPMPHEEPPTLCIEDESVVGTDTQLSPKQEDKYMARIKSKSSTGNQGAGVIEVVDFFLMILGSLYGLWLMYHGEISTKKVNMSNTNGWLGDRPVVAVAIAASQQQLSLVSK